MKRGSLFLFIYILFSILFFSAGILAENHEDDSTTDTTMITGQIVSGNDFLGYYFR